MNFELRNTNLIPSQTTIEIIAEEPPSIRASELNAKPMAIRGNDIAARPTSILRSVVTNAILPHFVKRLVDMYFNLDFWGSFFED